MHSRDMGPKIFFGVSLEFAVRTFELDFALEVDGLMFPNVIPFRCRIFAIVALKHEIRVLVHNRPVPLHMVFQIRFITAVLAPEGVAFLLGAGVLCVNVSL